MKWDAVKVYLKTYTMLSKYVIILLYTKEAANYVIKPAP